MAKPGMTKNGIPYEEVILHPAFNKEVKNAGSFVLSPDKKLLRRQVQPQVEEMEIGDRRITVRRNGKAVSKAIPARLKHFFDLLRAAILGQPLSPENVWDNRMIDATTGWRAEISVQAEKKEKITFSGCGQVLRAIELDLRNGQKRIIRFTAQ